MTGFSAPWGLNLVNRAARRRQKKVSYETAQHLQEKCLPTCDVKTRDSLLVRKLKTQPLGVGTEILDLSQLEINPTLVTAGKNLRALGRGSLRAGRVVPVQSYTKTNEADAEVDRSERRLALGGRFRGVFTEALRARQSAGVLLPILKQRPENVRSCVFYLLQGLSNAKRLTRKHGVCN